MKWQENKADLHTEVFQYARENGFCQSLAGVLARRPYLQQVSDLKVFLEKKRADLFDPFSLPDMQKAVERTEKAINGGEKMLIYGDFDADGLSALSILYWGLRKAGMKEGLYSYIPNRFQEGHGLSEEVISRFRAEGVSLLVTVDCGMGSSSEIRYAQSIGMDVIVTDHHLPEEDCPEAAAIVNPQLGGYPFPGLSGAGVAFKFVHALLSHLFGADSEICESTINNCVDYACIGTVADVVPLFGENRILVDWGLKHMSESRLPFLQRYWKRRIFGSKKQRPFRPEDISFYIAPRLNSASRLCSADSAFQFMISVQDKELEKLGAGLENMNRNRILRLQSLRKSTDLVYYPLSAQPVIVVDTRSEELGLLGLLASSIVDSTGRAAIVLGRSPNGLLAGSARSTEFLNLKALLDSVSDVLKSHGGHHRAAGLSLEPERLPEFLLKLEEVGQLKSFIVDKTEYYEAILPADEFNEGFFRQYESLGPFGKDNEPPVFGLSGFSLSYFRRKAAGGGSFMLNLNGKEFKSTFKKECDFDLTNGIPAQIFGSFCRDNKGENKLIFKMKGFQQSA